MDDEICRLDKCKKKLTGKESKGCKCNRVIPLEEGMKYCTYCGNEVAK